ncbi:NAD(P)-dependent dehydrogenase, short-chain alcohol dehydrogenase family [Chryseobacterium arachidis]|uniref:NAD(P)-dependent dehydrogenase, short-chain alcohol dehydrogenase family n=1 Tax=Chryseobacterium arachidis TaxID=1416778 RepID=A0A1M5JVL0_9FLAO|nr:SDR family oxidoreductase [Chryseobacterium arachidis]SHG44574.1 NAD(P)-dependent dehydrogenase, short-chain alcohol dehydrogenase family [Chryseobacterium arachidis]
MTKNIVITGGSSGIGKGIAFYFYNKGWNVLTTGRDVQKLEEIKNEMPQMNTIVYDSMQDGSETAIVDFIKINWNGRLDVLVNNAGHVELGELHGITQKSMENMYKAHLISPSVLSSACLPFLSETQGQILNISSSHGIKPYAQTTAYGSAKAALNMITKIWALELAPQGIRVNAIAPGPTETPILKKAGFDEKNIQAIHENESSSIPLKRRGQVDDIVAKAVLLLNSGSEWTTGVILPVDGGLSIS